MSRASGHIPAPGAWRSIWQAVMGRNKGTGRLRGQSRAARVGRRGSGCRYPPHATCKGLTEALSSPAATHQPQEEGPAASGERRALPKDLRPSHLQSPPAGSNHSDLSSKPIMDLQTHHPSSDPLASSSQEVLSLSLREYFLEAGKEATGEKQPFQNRSLEGVRPACSLPMKLSEKGPSHPTRRRPEPAGPWSS